AGEQEGAAALEAADLDDAESRALGAEVEVLGLPGIEPDEFRRELRRIRRRERAPGRRVDAAEEEPSRQTDPSLDGRRDGQHVLRPERAAEQLRELREAQARKAIAERFAGVGGASRRP